MGEYRGERSAVASLHAHLVFVTKYRRKVLTDRAHWLLRHEFELVCASLCVQLIEVNDEEDHVLLLVEYPPTLQLSRLVNRLKGSSSRRLRTERLSEVTAKLWGGHLWSPSYFAASCGGAPLAIVSTISRTKGAPRPGPEGPGLRRVTGST
ncbi:transposase (fragment) [Bradyrhizobium vignae]|uniref:Transposase n=1 Tax=Bradyrhizobium vignae TaxID=1549949 RepID=A0A2U3PUM9_9BRAD